MQVEREMRTANHTDAGCYEVVIGLRSSRSEWAEINANCRTIPQIALR